MIKKNSINSGRARVVNSTTIRQESNGSTAGRLIVKKTVSPSNHAQNEATGPPSGSNGTITAVNSNQVPS
jgi:hypothetical protein